MSSISENWKIVKDRVSSAAARSGRQGSDITLIAVTKTRSVDEIREVIARGATHIGENYVQEAEAKYGELGPIAKWHMIGHLQKNKARHVALFADMVHSVDSVELARELGRRAEAAGRVVEVLIEAKVSEEATKFGADPKQILDMASEISPIAGIKLIGLMGMAPYTENPEDTRPYFSALKEIWDKLPNEQRLYLSMGMTHDFEIAIEEGSNMVRIGTAIFGARA